MAVTTGSTLSVNGVVLNTLAKNIESLTGRLTVPPIRTGNITLPGRHGVLRTTRKMYGPGQIILPMWVRGLDDDGVVTNSQAEQFYDNVDTLTRLFRPGSGELLTVVHTLPDGSSRRVLAECTEAIEIKTSGGFLGKFSVALTVPSVFWEDELPISANVEFGHSGPVAQFSGMTAPVEDALFVITGPVTNPRVEALSEGTPLQNPDWFQYSGTVAAGQTLQVSCASWTLLGTNGLSVNYANFSHVGGTRWLTMVPSLVETSPHLKVTGSNTSAASKLTVTARRKYLVG